MTDRLRAALGPVAARGEQAGYGALARALNLPGPGSIARLAALLERSMAEDAAAGRPLLAAAMAARAGTRDGRGDTGLPAPGFFAAARALGVFGGPEAGPDRAAAESAFIAEQRAALLPGFPRGEWAFLRYESLRPVLPVASFPARSDHVADLSALTDRFDGFILDAYGVLNTGDAPIPGAVDRIAALRAAGKRVVVLTNGASQAQATALAKYRRLGFDFDAPEVVASRDVAVATLPGDVALWAAIAPAGAGFDDIPAPVVPLDDASLQAAGGFLFLGSEGWTHARQRALVAALRHRPRPLVVANPDVVAPRETGLSLEPGHFAHQIALAAGISPNFYGKPYGPALESAIARLAPIPRHRIAMVGDTLHTDVLGGRAAGVGTVLIARHGLFRGLDVAGFVARSGIVPDVIAETT